MQQVISLSSGVPLVTVQRSGVIESLHTGHVVVLGPDGTVRLSLGDPGQPMFARSCLKPLQAVGMLDCGLPATMEQTALAAASHSGSPAHLALIAESLAAAGLAESDLGCPADLPLGDTERLDYVRAGTAPARLVMNCSGKHAAMLRTCVHNGWSLADYLSPAHPLQQALASTISVLTDDSITAVGVDGCGAPVFATSLTGLARAFSRLALGDGASAKRVAEAVRCYPELVGGQRRLNTVLMQSVPGLIAKDGAEGCFAAALADGGALAVKIDDGAHRAAERAAVAALVHLGVPVPAIHQLLVAPVLGGGAQVGSVRAIF